MKSADPRPPSLSTVPTEMLLEIFARIPNLKALIAARCVNRTWRRLVPLADLNPHRRALLELYTDAVNSPGFLATRRDVVRGLAPFDREEWVNVISRGVDPSAPPGHPPITLPEEFRMWVLEWPSRAVISGHWPGLTVEFNQEHPIAKRRAWWKNEQEPSMLPWHYCPEIGRTEFVPLPTFLVDFELHAQKHAGSSAASWAGSRLIVSVLYLCRRQSDAQNEWDPYFDSHTEGLVVGISGASDSKGKNRLCEIEGPIEEGLHGAVHLFGNMSKCGTMAEVDENGQKRLKKPRRWTDFLREELEKVDRRFEAGPMSEKYKQRFRDAALGAGAGDAETLGCGGCAADSLSDDFDDFNDFNDVEDFLWENHDDDYEFWWEDEEERNARTQAQRKRQREPTPRRSERTKGKTAEADRKSKRTKRKRAKA
ncbi:hypothetical protein PLICRDRAFT_125501 [Plicaturopsis crispa FD-325 SS-3]|nr:hypothetical protein PLICRDRAFT_125501 [Plicaturopsis crispa FD-325 SS-3]